VTEPPSPPQRPSSLTTRWWWSSGLWIVAGAAIAYYQWTGIQAGGVWGNYVLGAVGVVLAVAGLVRLWRDWQVEQVRRASDDASASEDHEPPA
jgi:type VI protein secretion system component VasK